MHERAVLEARYFLIDLQISKNALLLPNNNSHDDDSHYNNIVGTFCPLDWHLQKSNPSSVSMFRDLVANSHHCQDHSVQLDLSHIVQQARHYDAHVVGAPKELSLAGLVFHETRCGSTLTANLLSAADPPAHRVYSEASPLLTAMLACNHEEEDCSTDKHSALLKDVLYLMGRSSDAREKRVFYKIQSVGVREMHVLTRVVPYVPWIFLYRNSVEVIMSHFKDATIPNMAVCLRGKKTPHALVQELVARQSREMKSLTNAEYCAAHLVLYANDIML
jgi:hypothetical protein